MTDYRERMKREIQEIADRLVADRGWGGPTFIARDLGFPDHTKIHEAVRVILAGWGAELIWNERQRWKED